MIPYVLFYSLLHSIYNCLLPTKNGCGFGAVKAFAGLAIMRNPFLFILTI